ncbi:MAG: hypothetical protein ACOX55_01590 [Christensenellales bacterium]
MDSNPQGLAVQGIEVAFRQTLCCGGFATQGDQGNARALIALLHEFGVGRQHDAVELVFLTWCISWLCSFISSLVEVRVLTMVASTTLPPRTIWPHFPAQG